MKTESKKKKGAEKLLYSFLHFLHRNKDNKDIALSEIIDAIDPLLKKQFETNLQEMVEYVLSICLHSSLSELNFYNLYNSFKQKFDPVVESQGISSKAMLKAILRTARKNKQ